MTTSCRTKLQTWPHAWQTAAILTDQIGRAINKRSGRTHTTDTPYWHNYVHVSINQQIQEYKIQLHHNIYIYIYKQVPKYLATGLWRPSETNGPPAETSTQRLKCKANTLIIFMHQMRISSIQVSLVMRRTKELEIRKRNSEHCKSCRMKTNQSVMKLSQIRRRIELHLMNLQTLLFSWKVNSYSYFKEVPKYLATGL
jgi:hypothetical protein